jgi:SAM-dependent methyltransferase
VIAIEDVLVTGQPIREIEPGLFSVLDPGGVGAPYDSRAAGYDWLVSKDWYSRVAWGVPPATHSDFIARALTSEAEGWVLDVAAGSCVASASAYASTSRPVIVLDLSLGMLRRGMARVRRMHGAIPSHLAFLQADAAALPVRDGSMTTVLCHGAFHVFSSPSAVCGEWARVLHAGGSLYVSSLVLGRWLGDRYLGLLHRAGEVAQPRDPAEVAAFLETAFGARTQVTTVGNFTYLSLRMPGPLVG